MKINYKVKHMRLPKDGETVEIDRNHPNYPKYVGRPWYIDQYTPMRVNTNIQNSIPKINNIPHIMVSSKAGTRWAVPKEIIKLIPDEN